MSVRQDGSDEIFSDLTMSLVIHHQEGCAFRGENIWSNDSLSGQEQVAGVLHSDGSLITMLEVGDHPFNGATARVFAQLVNGNQMSWEYAGWSADGTQGNVFSTLLTKN
jgi:hypothetical protein